MTKKERPILFSGPMVRAILDGRKTQTRRVVKLPLIDRHYMGNEVAGCEANSMLRQGHWELSPYGRPGDQLWVKETHWRFGTWRKNGITATGKQRWRFVALPHDLGVLFAAPGPFAAPEPPLKRGRKGWHKRPSIFMPRWASRITLEIESVRVERLQDISEEDVKAEGSFLGRCKCLEMQAKPRSGMEALFTQTGCYIHGEEFKTLWDSINAKTHPWDSNCWVWVITFRVV